MCETIRLFLQSFLVRTPHMHDRPSAEPHEEYRLTWTLDALRRSDFQRIDSAGETYVDYMGGALYPEGLLHVHTDLLRQAIMGNTHSASNP